MLEIFAVYQSHDVITSLMIISDVTNPSPSSLVEGSPQPQGGCEAGFYCLSGSYTPRPCPDSAGACDCEGDDTSIGGTVLFLV